MGLSEITRRAKIIKKKIERRHRETMTHLERTKPRTPKGKRTFQALLEQGIPGGDDRRRVLLYAVAAATVVVTLMVLQEEGGGSSSINNNNKWRVNKNLNIE